MAWSEPLPEDTNDTAPEPVPFPAVTPVAQESPFTLLLGILLFLGLLTLVWWNAGREPAQQAALAQSSIDARSRTYLVELLLYRSLRSTMPAWTRPLLPVDATATQAAQRWETISRKAADARTRGLTAMNAAALYGAVSNFAAARTALAHAAQRDAQRASNYRELLPLYARPPRPVPLSPTATGLVTAISGGPLIRARIASLRGDHTGVLAALQPGALAGQRLLLVNGILLLGVFGLLFTALFIYLLRGKRLEQEVTEVARAHARPVPWGIGMALVLISLVYLFASVISSLLRSLVHASEPGVTVVLSILAEIISAAGVLGLFLMLLGRSPGEWSLFGWHRGRQGFWYGVLVLVLVLPLFAIATVVAQRLFGDSRGVNPIIPELFTVRNPWVLAFIALSATVVAPLLEETLFRGILFRAADARLSFWPAAIGSGVLFGLVHAQLLAILPIAVLGATFAYLTRRTRGLLAPAAAHGVYNGIVTVYVLLTAWALRGPGS